MTNWQRWIVVLGFSFIAGAGNVAADHKSNWMDILRGGFVAMGPSAVALRMTLEKE